MFETFEKYFPVVVCIEGGQMLHPFHKRVEKNIAKKNIQQSLKVMVDSFEYRGYKILCSYQDSFFVKKEFYYLFDVSDDLLTLYFNGLRAIYKRMPFIQKYMKKAGLKNKIVDDILSLSNYNQYKWDRRKVWAKEQKNRILRIIDERERNEKR